MMVDSRRKTGRTIEFSMHNEDLSLAADAEKASLRPNWARRRRLYLWGLTVLVAGAAVLGSARFLLIDQPKPADVILVLAGETNARPARALELVKQGYASHVIMDVPDWSRFYGRSEMEIAREWANAQNVPVTICPISGLSTKAEARQEGECLTASGAHSVLIVTSDFHTRRALSVLRRELPSHEFSIAASYDPAEFGVMWWQHRQWAKTNFYEWTRLLWWELVDRWF